MVPSTLHILLFWLYRCQSALHEKSFYIRACIIVAWIWSYCEVEEQFSFWSKMTFETYITINKRSFQVIDCLKFGIWILCCRLFHKNKKRTQKTIKLTKQTLQKKHTQSTLLIQMKLKPKPNLELPDPPPHRAFLSWRFIPTVCPARTWWGD